MEFNGKKMTAFGMIESESVVRYTEQILTDEQKAQARENVGAVSTDLFYASTSGFVTPQQYGAVCDGVTDDTSAINAMFDAVETGGSVVFPAGATFVISKQIYITGKDNLIVDFNGCVFKPANQFEQNDIPSYIGRNTMLCVDNCKNITIKNAVFDCDTWNNGFTWFMGAWIHNSVSRVKDCIFRNADYHHLIIKNGLCTGEDLIFENLGGTGGMSDIYTECDDNSSTETHWRNLKSTRDTYNTGQLCYFGVTSDTQQNYHTVDGAEANNCGPIIDLRGGEGFFRNIRGDICGGLNTLTAGTTTKENAPIVSFENVHLTNIVPDGYNLVSAASGIYLHTCRRAYINNVVMERTEETSNNLFKVIRLGQTAASAMNDIHISNVRYKGIKAYAAIAVQGDITCNIENVTVESEASKTLYVANGTGENVVRLTNVKSPGDIYNDGTAKIIMNSGYKAFGTTAERPKPFPCEIVLYYDTDLSALVVWNGTEWKTVTMS